MPLFNRLDDWLIHPPALQTHSKIKRFGMEFLWFGLKEARACLFAGIIFLSMMVIPKAGIMGLPRYDVLLIIALLAQFCLVYFRLETMDEFKAIMLFHLVGFVMEAFKVSANIGSWQYPQAAYSKVFGVPLFTGFMYAAVGSYIIQCWRLLDLKIRFHPPYVFAVIVSLLIYINFFSHHFIGDYRWYIVAATVGLYARTMVIFTPYDKERKIPLLVSFVLIGFFLWLAENIGTLLSVWQYPNQLGAWSVVHIGKWSSWALLVIMTFTITIFLKHIKATIHIPK